MAADESNPKERTGALASRGPAFMSSGRPLDALIPELQVSRTVGMRPVHPRVLEVDTDDGYEWVFAVWHNPGDPVTLHGELKKLIETTLLLHLSQAPAQHAEKRRTFSALRLFLFDDVAGGVEPAVRAFGFSRDEYQADRFIGRMAALHNEAESIGWQLPEQPISVWRAPIQHPEGALGEQLATLNEMMAKRMGPDVWGHTPSGPSRLLAKYMRQFFKERITPDLAGLDTLEMLLLQRVVGVIRWIPAMLFQALADFIGVVIQSEFGLGVDWGECTPDEAGFAPPPLLRVHKSDAPTHLAVGTHLLRWCMMPLQPGEDIPPLSAWLRDEFGDG